MNREYLTDKNRKRPNIFRRIELWYRFEGRYLIKDTIKGISNLVFYFKTIWNDRSYDFRYIEEIYLTKFKRILQFYDEYETYPVQHENWRKQQQVVRIMINILERRKTSWYSDVVYTRITHKRRIFFELIEGKVDENGDNYYTLGSEGLTDEEEQKSKELHILMGNCEKRDWKIYCKLMEKYHETLWH